MEKITQERTLSTNAYAQGTLQKQRPEWLNKKIDLSACNSMKSMLRDLSLHTVCEEAACPNISECFHKGTATFMILGSTCTRSCKFCNIKEGKPSSVDSNEPSHVADAVERFKLRHVVITSVTRDDLSDGGAEQFAETILAVRNKTPNVKIEVLVPDFMLNIHSIVNVVAARPDIINHNIETVARLYNEVRPQAVYRRSLELLRICKGLAGGKFCTKSGIMVGLGETQEEVLSTISDIRRVGTDFLSIGQYLAPSREHYPVKEYVKPEVFKHYGQEAKKLGFKSVSSAPYVRSSYLAEEYL